MPSPTHRVPPMVRATVNGVVVYAYVLEWVGQDRMRVGWCEQYSEESYQWRWAVADLPRGDIEELPGQSYVAVPTGAEGAREVEAPIETRTWRKMKRG